MTISIEVNNYTSYNGLGDRDIAMETYLREIKVFIGSPSDLDEERALFRNIVAEVNRIKANPLKIHLQPVGWEDTLIGIVRPQERINKDIEECDLAVLLLRKRWGTQTEQYTSGFEEEYELAKSLNDKSGKPEIFLYFRGNLDDLRINMDEQTIRVVDFRDKIRKEQNIFYKEYEEVNQWERYLREHLCRWLDFVSFATSSGQTIRLSGRQQELEGPFESAISVPGIPEWTIVDTPDSVPSLTKELLNPDNQGAGINKIAVASDGKTIWAIVRRGDRNGIGKGGGQIMLYMSSDGGCSWSDKPYNNLVSVQSVVTDGTFVWDIALAPDNPNITAVACADINKAGPLAQEVWISTDKGISWQKCKWPPTAINPGVDLISTIDISSDFGGRKILVGTRNGTGLCTKSIQVMDMGEYGRWNTQDTSSGSLTPINPFTGDVLVARFSPNFVGDSTIVVVYSDSTVGHEGTWLVTGIHNIAGNTVAWQNISEHVEIRNAGSSQGDSPRVNEIITADLALPPDFSGQNSNLRHFYISTDAVDREFGARPNRGVYRIDDNVVYTLRDNTNTFGFIDADKPVQRASSIAYASGKLLVGEVLGDTCRAVVQTSLNESPMACSIDWWLEANKPCSGARRQASDYSAKHVLGYGNAKVVWSPIYPHVAYAATSSASLGPWATPAINNDNAIVQDIAWPAGYVNVTPCDESALSISRDHGELWNQISLINSHMDRLTDVAPALDCSTIYLTSINANLGPQRIHSVWRSSADRRIVFPLPALPIGQVWERVLTFTNDTDGSKKQAENTLLRMAPDKSDGQILFCAAGGTNDDAINGQIIMWTPDYGDYWVEMRPNINVQDIAAASSTRIYVLSAAGIVQKMDYTGTHWSSRVPPVNVGITGHSIAAFSDDWVLIGANNINHDILAPVAYSNDGATTFSLLTSQDKNAGANVHVTFDLGFPDNSTIYICYDRPGGRIYRWVIGTSTRWDDLVGSRAIGSAHCDRYYGLVVAQTGGTLYAVHGTGALGFSGVECTLHPRASWRSSGISWNCFHRFHMQPIRRPVFSREPWSLKHCGNLTLDTDTILFAIDNAFYANNHNTQTAFAGVAAVRGQGMLWKYTDSVAKQQIIDQLGTNTM